MDHGRTPTKCSYTKPIINAWWVPCGVIPMGCSDSFVYPSASFVNPRSQWNPFSSQVLRHQKQLRNAAGEIRSVPKSFNTKSNSAKKARLLQIRFFTSRGMVSFLCEAKTLMSQIKFNEKVISENEKLYVRELVVMYLRNKCWKN